MIRLHHSAEAIRSLLRDAVASFEGENPETRWAFLGLDVAFMHGSIAVNFDTKNHNAATQRTNANVATFFSKGTDVLGPYNNNCVDFKFARWRELVVDEWSNQYFGRNEEDLVVEIRPGTVERFGAFSSDEQLNEYVFPFFLDVLRSETSIILRNARNVDVNARTGVQMCDSACVSFWLA